MTVTELDHVLVLADDIDATRDFYRDLVGLRVGDRPGLEFPGYWLYADRAGACLHIAQRGPYREHAAGIGLDGDAQVAGKGPVDHIAFTAEDIDELLARLDRVGVSAVLNQVPGGPRQVFVEDPNGVGVEINFR